MSVGHVKCYYFYSFSSTDSDAMGVNLGAENEWRNTGKMSFQLLKEICFHAIVVKIIVSKY